MKNLTLGIAILFFSITNLFSVPLSDLHVGDMVGKYHGNSEWKGIITQKSGDKLKIEVTEVSIVGTWTTHITGDDCTGNKDLSSRSIGTIIWVPYLCIDKR